MKKLMRSALALLLAVLMTASLAATALAEGPAGIYTDEQYYEADESQETYYTVQVSAGCNLDGAQRVRQTMLKAGFDCFVYYVDGMYRVMCGKFQHKEDALRYRDLIRENGKEVEIKLFKAVDKQKEFTGILKGFDDQNIVIENEGTETVLERSNIAMIRLALDF